MKNNSIQSAYKQSKNIYDDFLTQQSILSKLYNHLFWNVDDIQIAKHVLDALPNDFSGKLLDVPTGTAIFTYEKYRKFTNSEIYCLDYSNDMLQQAKQRFTNMNHIHCIQGDVGKLPFGNHTFDIVISMNGFHAFPDKEKAFSEIYRVLKLGGIFSGCCYIKGESKRSDFLVNLFLSKKGWFTPPFMNLTELQETLNKQYTSIHISHENAIAYFTCKKR